MVEFKQAKQILDTLPISFYLKRKIKADLKDENTSYCDIYNDEIVVGLKQFANASVSENDAESDIRCLLYHEVSHALLTPTQLFGEVLRYRIDSTRRIMNIFPLASLLMVQSANTTLTVSGRLRKWRKELFQSLKKKKVRTMMW